MQSKNTWFRLKDTKHLGIAKSYPTTPVPRHKRNPLLACICVVPAHTTQHSTTQHNLKTGQICEEMFCVLWAEAGMAEQNPVINFQCARQGLGQLASDIPASQTICLIEKYIATALLPCFISDSFLGATARCLFSGGGWKQRAKYAFTEVFLRKQSCQTAGGGGLLEVCDNKKKEKTWK